MRWMNLENIMWVKETKPKDYMLYDSIYMKYPEYANLLKQEVDYGLPVDRWWGPGMESDC